MSQINYVPDIHILQMGASYGPYGSGHGSPEGVATGFPGNTYVDVDSGDFYAFTGDPGSTSGWTLVTGGGGGGGGTAQLVTYTSGTPANPTNQSLPALAYDPTGHLATLGWNTSTHVWN